MDDPINPPDFKNAFDITIKKLESTLWLTAYQGDPQLVVDESQLSPQHFEILRLKIGQLIIDQQPLPDPYRFWLHAFLYDGVKPPTRSKGAQVKSHRTSRVVDLVSDLVALGMQPTRNDYGSNKSSACDVVAEALASLDKQPQSYSRVKRIWLENKDKTSE